MLLSRGFRARIAATLCVLTSAALLLAGCTATETAGTETAPEPVVEHGPVTTAAIEHLGAAPCTDDDAAQMQGQSVEGILCGALTVPLDHGSAGGETLTLDVAIREGDGDRGVLVLIGGGPGGTIRWATALLAQLMPEVAEQYQLVAMDPRGTGNDAIDCPALQTEVGSSDVLAASTPAIDACFTLLGERAAVQSTADTVADFELLREALGVDAWVLDGTSYGTFVAQQYAMLHPEAISALVLDSLVPAEGVDPFLLSSFGAVARVLDEVCEAVACDFDPGEAVESVLAGGYPALPLLNALIASSVMDPEFSGVLDTLQSAANGDTSGLDAYVSQMRTLGAAEPLSSFSAGSHIATLCADTPMPWGGADTDLASRETPLTAAVNRISPEDTWPFAPSLAAQLGPVVGCLHWPTTVYSPSPASGDWFTDTARSDTDNESGVAALAEIPLLILTGSRDLSTPVANADVAVRAMPHAISVVIPGAGHAAQMRPAGSAAVTDFLLGL